MSKISCVIVSYNNGRYLKEAILSVLQQTFPVKEILVADDASTDGSRELVHAMTREYRSIKGIFREQNLGVAANRDLAIRQACGELVTTLDGDDLFLSRKVEAEYLALRSLGTNSAIAFSDICLATTQGEVYKRVDTSSFAQLNSKKMLRWLACRLGPIPRDMLLAKSVYLELNGMRHALATYEDWDFKIRLAARSGKWLYSGVDGVVYRQHPSGLSAGGPFAQFNAQRRILWDNKALLTERIGFAGFAEALLRIAPRVGLQTASRAMRMVRRASQHYMSGNDVGGI